MRPSHCVDKGMGRSYLSVGLAFPALVRGLANTVIFPERGDS